MHKRISILASKICLQHSKVASTYAVLSDLLALDKSAAKTFDEISTALSNHFEPKRSVITERFHFHKCHRMFIIILTFVTIDANICTYRLQHAH